MAPSTAETSAVLMAAAQDSNLTPASSHVTVDIDGAVLLRTGPSYPDNVPAVTLPELLERTAAEHPAVTALVAAGKDGKQWNYRQYHQDVLTTAKAFIKLGLRPR